MIVDVIDAIIAFCAIPLTDREFAVTALAFTFVVVIVETIALLAFGNGRIE